MGDSPWFRVLGFGVIFRHSVIPPFHVLGRPSIASSNTPFSSPEPTILLVCARDRDLWQGPKQEVRESRTSGFYAQPQKFETITVTIGYKNGQLLRLRVTWSQPEVSIPGADQKDRGLWG